jgi:hypothetical protein
MSFYSYLKNDGKAVDLKVYDNDVYGFFEISLFNNYENSHNDALKFLNLTNS